MSINLRRAGAIGLAAAVVAGLAVAGAGSAQAATIGTLTGIPATGSVNGTFGIVASSLCPTGTDGLSALINNAAAGWSEVPLVGFNDTEINNINTTGLQAADTLASIASTNNPALTLSPGTYAVRLDCKSGFVDVLGSFTGSFTITGTNYAFDAVTPPTAPASTTTLTVDKTSPQNVGTTLTLNATVTSTATVAGSVQFKDGSADLGAPVAVSAAGKASLPTSALTGGTHSLTAVFIPTTPANIAASTSDAVSFTITAPAVTTTTTLASSPAAPTTVDVVSLTASVSPVNAAGTVSFKEGSTTVGTAVVNGGTASVSLTGLSAGTHSYTADFVPTSSAAFLPSSASAASVTVTEFAGVKASESITTKVDSGALIITAGGATVDLGTLALNSGNSLLVSAPKDINPVTVTDTRAGNLGWNVNGTVADFTSGSNQISSANLGWTPKVISQDSVQTVTAGAVVAPGAGIAAGAASTAGLKSASLLGSAVAGKSIGTAQLGASLVLQAPTSTKPGTYNTTLTLTAI
jgi:hypothetical protein